MITKNKQFNFDVFYNWLIYLLFFLFIILSLRYQFFLLNYRTWEDESETIVAAKMMASGMYLYSEIFNHHGPLTFLPAFVLEQFGEFEVIEHRVLIAFFQFIAIFSIYKTPILNSVLQKIIVTIISSVIVLGFLPDIFGHMYKYQTIAGIFLTIIFAQYVIPAICCPDKLRPLVIVLGNILIVSLPFLAITYLPIAALLFCASYRKIYNKYIILGVGFSLLTNLFFLGGYGSFSGFAAFHLYLNAKILPLYSGIQSGSQLIIRAIRIVTSNFTYFLPFIIIISSSFFLAKEENKFPWRTLLVITGILSLLIRVRTLDFHGIPYFYACLPFIGLLLNTFNAVIHAHKTMTIILLIVCILKISFFFPEERQKILNSPLYTESVFARIVDNFTFPEDKIIAYSFRNTEYLLAKRLPASGHFFYLPWQEKYNEKPQFGIMIDACKQITDTKPKVMLIDKWLVWKRYTWESYSECIQKFIDSNYIQIPNQPYYIRKDLLSDYKSSDILHIIENKFYLTDENWTKGIARRWSGFFVPNTPKFKVQYVPSRSVKLKNGDIRKILTVSTNHIYLNVTVTGNIINPEVVGYPYEFEVLQ